MSKSLHDLKEDCGGFPRQPLGIAISLRMERRGPLPRAYAEKERGRLCTVMTEILRPAEGHGQIFIRKLRPFERVLGLIREGIAGNRSKTANSALSRSSEAVVRAYETILSFSSSSASVFSERSVTQMRPSEAATPKAISPVLMPTMVESVMQPYFSDNSLANSGILSARRMPCACHLLKRGDKHEDNNRENRTGSDAPYGARTYSRPCGDRMG